MFFYGDRIFVGRQDYPIGQCCVDILNLDESIFDEISQRVMAFVPAARDLLTEKTDSAAALAQERLNAVWEVIFVLPVYRDLKMDEPCSYHTFQRLMMDREKWEQVQDPSSSGYARYQGMLMELICFAERLSSFRKLIAIMTEKCLEPLKRRNSSAYAEAYSYFYMQMLSVGIQVFGADFDQSIPVDVSFVPMMHPTGDGKIFIAEKAAFNNLMDFLQTEFYRGLAWGNAPRQCHNCGRYFLLTAEYNTCYCNSIAPGETVRTCRKVGAHRKEARDKENRTSARQRGKISRDEWNAAVAKAQELVTRSERGELSDEELKRLLGEL